MVHHEDIKDISLYYVLVEIVNITFGSAWAHRRYLNNLGTWANGQLRLRHSISISNVKRYLQYLCQRSISYLKNISKNCWHHRKVMSKRNSPYLVFTCWCLLEVVFYKYILLKKWFLSTLDSWKNDSCGLG